MLLSIQLNSNRPENIEEFIDNIEQTASNPSEIEIIFNIDQGDEACRNILEKFKATSKTKIKYLETNIIKSYKDLWKPLNELLKLTDPNVYFVTNFSDEFRFKTKGWDDIIKKYIGYYEDNIFRIRLSRYRYRNYNDFWECIFAPDSLSFYTKKWMDIVGTWCPCLGPDSWQQLVAFYLINSRKFDHIQYNRDIPEAFIEFEGEGASIGLTGEKARQRIKDNVDLWFETVSYKMQKKAKHAAAKLQAAIILYDQKEKKISHNFLSNRKPPLFNNKKLEEITLKDHKKKNRLEFYYQKKLIYKISYKINKLKLFWINNIRKPNYGYYAGGGQECFRKDIVSQINVYFRMKRYGIFGNSKHSLSKPKIFKNNRLLSPFWPVVKIVLLIFTIFKYLVYKLLLCIPNAMFRSFGFYYKIVTFSFSKEVKEILPESLRDNLIKATARSLFKPKDKLLKYIAETANFLFRAGYTDESAFLLDATLKYKFDKTLMYNYFNCLLLTSPKNYDHKKYLESMLYYTEKHIPYNSQGSFKIKDLNPNKKLKVGYICHFFASNISQAALWLWISNHNKEDFEVYALSDDRKAGVVPNNAEQFDKFKESVNFVDTSDFDEDQFCEFIINNEFDILLELNGYCDFNRYIEINRKIAPVQISFYNISGPSGLRGIDYIFHEPLTNVEPLRHFYTEKFFKLDHSSSMKFADYYPEITEAPFIKNGYITFGHFGAIHKVHKDHFKLWCEILKKVPNSKIFLKALSFSDADIVKIFEQNFIKNGIDLSRVIIEGPEPHKDMLKKYSQVDIALDTFPHGAGSTTNDCLYMGIPIVALNGERLCSQHGIMIIGAIGHPELITESDEDYIKKAVELANDKEKIIYYRNNLRYDHLKSQKGDNKGFIKKLEESYRTMWKTFVNNQS